VEVFATKIKMDRSLTLRRQLATVCTLNPVTNNQSSMLFTDQAAKS